MKITLIYKLSTFVLSMASLSVVAQNRLDKLQEQIKVASDVVVRVNSSHTTVLLETWNQNSVAIEAYVQGTGINTENSERLLQNWNVETSGSTNEITINSVTGNFWSEEVAVAGSPQDLKQLSQTQNISPIIAQMLRPILEKIEENPMPSALSQQLASMDFDNNAYQKDEEKYIKQWGDQIKEKFGDDSDNVLRGWAQQLSLQTNTTHAIEGISFPNWGGEAFARQMEAWASQFSGSVAIAQQNGSNITVYRYASTSSPVENTERVLKVRVPINARVKFDMRHGDLKLSKNIMNTVASLSHTSLEAEEITGNRTLIKVSYAPVYVKQWNDGSLIINYVKNCRIQNATGLRVNADSSNIFVNELAKNASITGSFGAITIANLSERFSTLDLAIENSDFKLKLPETAFNFTYSGTQSRIKIPKTIEVNARKNFGNIFVNGFQKTRDTDKTITIHATYSDIDLH